MSPHRDFADSAFDIRWRVVDKQGAERLARMRGSGRSQYATQPCPHPEQLHRERRAVVALDPNFDFDSFFARRLRLLLQLREDPRSVFSRRQHAAPRSARRLELRERRSARLRNSTCSDISIIKICARCVPRVKVCTDYYCLEGLVPQLRFHEQLLKP